MVDDEKKLYGEELPKAYTERVMTDVVYEQAHKFVLFNHPAMACWMEKYMKVSQGIINFPTFRHWVRNAILQILGSGEHITQEAYEISTGPNVKAKYFSGMWNKPEAFA